MSTFDIKPGDEVFLYTGGYDREPKRCKVERTTKTRIIVNGAYFTKRGCGVGRWSTCFLRRITPELEQRIKDDKIEDEQKEALRCLSVRLEVLASRVKAVSGYQFRAGQAHELAALAAAVERAEQAVNTALYECVKENT